MGFPKGVASSNEGNSFRVTHVHPREDLSKKAIIFNSRYCQLATLFLLRLQLDREFP